MTEAPQNPGFRAQMRERMSREPVSLVPVTERNIQRFDSTLADLTAESRNDGMLNINKGLEESNEGWLSGVKALWLVGQHDADFSKPEGAFGFVNVYVPEHPGAINDWLLKRRMRAYDPGALVEMASFVKHGPESAAIEHSANTQALAKVFMDDAFKDVRAVTMWVTHSPENALDSKEAEEMKQLGGWALGSRTYAPSESVDSTCFLITRRNFLDAYTGQKRV